MVVLRQPEAQERLPSISCLVRIPSRLRLTTVAHHHGAFASRFAADRRSSLQPVAQARPHQPLSRGLAFDEWRSLICHHSDGDFADELISHGKERALLSFVEALAGRARRLGEGHFEPLISFIPAQHHAPAFHERGAGLKYVGACA